MERAAEGKIPAMIGSGIAVPDQVITNQDIDNILGKRPGTIDRLMDRGGIGISQRHWITVGKEATSDLCAQALIRAVDNARVNIQNLKAIWIATSSPDYLGTSTAAILQHKLGLSNNILGSNNADACPGFVMALYRAFTDLTSPLGRGGPQAVIGAEVISTSLSRKKGVVIALFGDGAGAVIVDNVIPDEGTPTNIGFAFGLDGKYAEDLGVLAGGSKNPTSLETVNGDLHSVHMNGELIFNQAVSRMSKAVEQARTEADIPIGSLRWFIPHQANGKIIHVTAERLGIPDGKVVINIDRYGNTSAASIPIALDEAVRDGRIKRNDLVGVASFGAGLIFNAAVIPMVGLPQ